MAFDLTAFRSRVGKLTRGAHFEFRIIKPPSSQQTFQLYNTLRAGSDLTFLAKKQSLPGQQLQTHDSTLEYGPHRKIPFAKIYQDLDVDFILEDTFQAKRFFDTWQDEQVGVPSRQNFDSYDLFDPTWYDDYIAEVQVIQYNQKGVPIYVVNMFEAYPISVSPVDLDWEARDQLQLVNVQFAYRWHKNLLVRT